MSILKTITPYFAAALIGSGAAGVLGGVAKLTDQPSACADALNARAQDDIRLAGPPGSGFELIGQAQILNGNAMAAIGPAFRCIAANAADGLAGSKPLVAGAGALLLGSLLMRRRLRDGGINLT
jgi:hypothetical protein